MTNNQKFRAAGNDNFTMMIAVSVIFMTLLGNCMAASVNQKYRKLTDVILPTTTSSTIGLTATGCCQRCSSNTSCKRVGYDVTNQFCEESTSTLLLSASALPPLEVYLTDVNKVYELVRTGKTWLHAKTYCADRGGQLTKIDSVEKTNQLTSWLNEYGHNIDLNSVRGPWTGLNDLTDNDWLWADGSALGGYVNWLPNQPSNDTEEDCAHIVFPEMTWNKYICDAVLWSVCEYN